MPSQASLEDYVPLRKAHITTRQNIQMHHIPLAVVTDLDARPGPERAVLARGLRQHRAQRDG